MPYFWQYVCYRADTSVVPRICHRMIADNSTCGMSEDLPEKPTCITVTMMASNDLVVFEEHL